MPFLKKVAAGLLQPFVLLSTLVSTWPSGLGTRSIESNDDDHGPMSDLLKRIVGEVGPNGG